MALSAGLAVSVQVLIGSTWKSLSSRDVIQSLRIQYGLSSNGPTDCLAATGECEYTLRNDAGNSGGVAGLYSPLNRDRKSTRLNSSHSTRSRMPSSA